MITRQNIAQLIYPEVFSELSKTQDDVMSLKKQYDVCNNETMMLADQIDALQKDKQALNDQITLIKTPPLSPIDTYLSSKFAKCEKIAYTNKRYFEDAYGKVNVEIDMYMNQLITPDNFEVVKLRKSICLNADDVSNIPLVFQWVDINITWTDDKTLSGTGDFYLYSEEIIKRKRDDCEGKSCVCASLLPNVLAEAWGYKGTQGHCFNLYVQDNELWVLDTSFHQCVRYTGSDYHICYICTKDFTYALDTTTQFGVLAQWK